MTSYPSHLDWVLTYINIKTNPFLNCIDPSVCMIKTGLYDTYALQILLNLLEHSFQNLLIETNLIPFTSKCKDLGNMFYHNFLVSGYIFFLFLLNYSQLNIHISHHNNILT